jgi:predicted nucleic acid-binding protein
LSLYLDASVLLSIVNDEQPSKAVERFLAEAGTSLWVSEFASAEVASAFSRLVRMGNLTSARARDGLVAYDGWVAAEANAIDVEGQDVRLATSLVRRFDLMLRAPDALHLAICRRVNATIATLDRRLAVAAQALDIAVASL